MRRAAEAGYAGAARLFGMTPAEIELELAAFAARQRQEWERLDAAAWLAARYAVIGWHMPKKFPKRPSGVARRTEAMSDAAMKNVFLAMAGRSEDE